MRVVIYGSGGHAKVVADLLIAAGEDVVGFVDDEPSREGAEVLGLPVLGGWAWLEAAEDVGAALGIGSNQVRYALAKRCAASGVPLVTGVHPRAVVARSATLAEGAMVMAGALINPDARVGRGAIVNTGAVVEHDVVIGDFAHLSPNAATGGGARLDEQAHVGVGAVLLPLARVGARSIVGGGAVVTKAVPADVVAAGVPARVIRRIER